MQRLLFLAINTRMLMLMGLRAMRAPEANVGERHAQAAAHPAYIENINAATVRGLRTNRRDV